MSEPNDSSHSQINNDASPVLRHPAWLSPQESPQAIHNAVSKLINFMSQSKDARDCDLAEGEAKPGSH